MKNPTLNSLQFSFSFLYSIQITFLRDKVCWDTFDSDEIWASTTRSDRRPSGGPPGPGPKGPGGRLRDFDSGDEGGPPARGSVGGPPHRGSMDRGMDRGSSSGRGGFDSGRWQRGVALPEGDTRSNSRGRDDDRGMSRNSDYEADNPDDLWDDVGAGPSGAASDFSAFGGSLEDDHPKGKTGMGAFDLSDMSAAAAAFEDELHGGKSKADNGTSNGALEDEDDEGISHQVDASRPLATTGTTIRSGSGDHVNVFEDFGDEEDNNETEEELPIKSGTGDNNASSRLMKMIGVSGTGEASGSGVVAEPEEPAKPEESTPPEVETKPRSDSVPSNPWGAPAATSVSSNPWGGPSGPAAQQQKEEELHRQQQRQKQLQEEEEKKRWAAAQAKQQAEMEAKQRQQQEEQIKQQQNQVELVLIERITNILENSWGRSDLNSILSTLHANDSRVIAILSTIDALRQLISRHPQRIQLGRDPTMGAEMAAVRMTNAQWQAHQAQQQAQEQELLRRKQLQEEQARVAAQQQEALVRAQLEAAERRKQQQSSAPPMITDAPWFYADPQGNIQGPFGGDEMRQWLEAGYFKGDLPISQSPKGPFHTLSSYFSGDASNAFKPTVDSRAEEEAKAAAEARAKAEAEARATAEAEAKAKARLEAKAARDREKAELAAAKARADAEAEAEKAKADRSQQSTQLKMMLGVGGTGSSSDGIAGPPQPEPVAAPPTKKQGKKATQKQQKPTVPAVAQAPAVAATKPAAPPAPAWGGGSKAQARNKSMSEIQQEEAREAARRAKEQGLNGSSSGGGGGGWANIASSGGSSAWGGQAKTPVAGVVVAGVGTTQPQQPQKAGGAVWNKPNAKPKAATAKKPAQAQSTASSKNTAVDNFGTDGRMTPTLEVWCKEQMQKINGSDDLTLVQFCLTLTDSDEIRQYLTAYLGSTPQVNNFATEFIKKKGGDNGRQEEWVSNKKGGRKSKKGGK